ncbi:MAG: hypothetical protein LJE65_04410 [Desulfobacteraceae bacterium]|jgi:hypothetical protein|nr:hypothetical protein [Desulfobacteraceae bacterium]
MRSVLGKEALWMVAFAAIAVVAFGTFYLFAEKVAHPNSLYRRYAKQEQTKKQRSWVDDRTGVVALYRDQAVEQGGKRWIYKGFEDGRIRIDVIVLGLDPEAVYTYRIPPDPGPGGFQLSGRRFRPLTVRDGLIRIQELPASP